MLSVRCSFCRAAALVTAESTCKWFLLNHIILQPFAPSALPHPSTVWSFTGQGSRACLFVIGLWFVLRGGRARQSKEQRPAWVPGTVSSCPTSDVDLGKATRLFFWIPTKTYCSYVFGSLNSVLYTCSLLLFILTDVLYVIMILEISFISGAPFGLVPWEGHKLPFN